MKNNDFINLQKILESINNNSDKMSLNDIYGDLNDISEDEILYHLVDPELGDVPINIMELTIPNMKNLMTDKGDMTAINAYRSFADKDQKNIINHYRKNITELFKYPIIIKDNMVIDGYHRLIAAILNNTPIKALNISEII